jgi:hypothetical protein
MHEELEVEADRGTSGLRVVRIEVEGHEEDE